MLMRKNKGITETVELDLTASDFITSDYFWLKPNDIIYVRPLKSKMITVNSSTISVALGAISVALASITTLILMLNYIQP